jgi:hypothetical protein
LNDKIYKYFINKIQGKYIRYILFITNKQTKKKKNEAYNKNTNNN